MCSSSVVAKVLHQDQGNRSNSARSHHPVESAGTGSTTHQSTGCPSYVQASPITGSTSGGRSTRGIFSVELQWMSTCRVGVPEIATRIYSNVKERIYSHNYTSGEDAGNQILYYIGLQVLGFGHGLSTGQTLFVPSWLGLVGRPKQ